MKIEDLDFTYPEDLIAQSPSEHFRCLFSDGKGFFDLTKDQFLSRFQKGDVLVINNTQVLKRRVFSEEGFEVLFLNPVAPLRWKVLFPSSRLKSGQRVQLPGAVSFRMWEGGLPQTIELSQALTDEYFEKYGELPLPPYIQKARGERNNREADRDWYQTDWAEKPGSLAAPTASLHFSQSDLAKLIERGVQVVPVTLHIGLGTFLPIQTSLVEDHPIHSEWVSVPATSAEVLREAKEEGRRIWALGTTVVRTLESLADGHLEMDEAGNFSGETRIYIYPGYEFKMVDALLTNFHQPRSTLMALVAAFAGLERTKAAYQWAIENRFRLFSYGDLSAWTK